MPNSEVVKRALEQIRKRPVNHDYFFSKLNSADWIEPLDQAGLFAAPPQAIREGDTISFSFWPESQYLARVAAEAPEQVAAVMMKIPATDNVRVHDDLARAATKLPGFLAAQWASKETKWVEQQERLYFLPPGTLGELIVHLAASGELQASLAFARAVLAVRQERESTRRVYAKLDAWNYEQLLQKFFPEFLHYTARDGLNLLFELLDEALIEDSEGDEDYSWIWRPAIEPHVQNHGHGDLRDALIDAIRDGSIQLIRDGVEATAVMSALLDRNRPVFKRIALHLAAENRTDRASMDLAYNRAIFFDDRLRHEYGRLLKAVFGQLAPQAKAAVLSWIDEGPSQAGTEGDDSELLRKRKANWQALRLSGLRGQLPDEWEQHYLAIVSELGAPEHPDFASYSTVSIGPTSPKDASELAAMSADEIGSFLESWVPTDGWQTPKPEGLGRVLQSVVAKSPTRFVARLESFRNSNPTYSRALVQALADALNAGHTLEWPSVVEYLSWIVAQPRDKAIESNDSLDRDPHWGWARKAVASLLSAGFERNTISLSLRERAWHIVDTIADDPHPTADDDNKATMDPATRSINTIRGEALHAVIRYSLWIRRATAGEETATSITFDMSFVPEVRSRLERHLDPNFERSTAIRAVFGQWFPWLVVLDRSWAEAMVGAIFPADNRVLREAAWHTYLAFCGVYDEPFRLLRMLYSAAVDRLHDCSEVNATWIGRPGEHIGEHLMVMVGRGALAWHDDLVRNFFANASAKDASHALAFVGRSLRNESNPVPIEVVDRFRRFWEEFERHVLAGPSDRMQSLKLFGWWFASGSFDIEWAFDHLKRVIAAAGGIDPDFMVMERIATLAEVHTAPSLGILRALARQDERGWSVLGWTDSARTVLQAALAAGSTNAETRALIHELGTLGYLEFRELLST